MQGYGSCLFVYLCPAFAYFCLALCVYVVYKDINNIKYDYKCNMKAIKSRAQILQEHIDICRMYDFGNIRTRRRRRTIAIRTSQDW